MAIRRPRKFCTKARITKTSVKRWFTRPFIQPRLLVLHSTESHNRPGLGDVKSVAEFLANGGTQADVHVIIDAAGHKARLVPDGRKAWHVAGYNWRALGIEQIGIAATEDWRHHEAQLNAVAAQLACWSWKYNIPLVDARKDKIRGVVTHASLGTLGGGHTDPGPNYPFMLVLNKARALRGQKPLH